MSQALNVGARAARFQQYRAMQQLANGVGIRKARAMQREATRMHTKLSDHITMRQGLVQSHDVKSRVHRAWSDMLRSKPLHQRPVDPFVMDRSISVPAPLVHKDGTRTMRGAPCLFDDCTMVELNAFGGISRHKLQHWSAPVMRYVGRSVLKRQLSVYDLDPGQALGPIASVAYHVPVGSVPAMPATYNSKARARAELDDQVLAWRQAKQLAHAQALMGD